MQPWVYQSMNYSGSHVYQNILPNLSWREQLFMPVCLTVVSFINLTHWDLVQSADERKLSIFMIFANDSNLKTVNSGHFQALGAGQYLYLGVGWQNFQKEGNCKKIWPTLRKLKVNDPPPLYKTWTENLLPYDAINITISNLFINQRMLQTTVYINNTLCLSLDGTKFQLHAQIAHSRHACNIPLCLKHSSHAQQDSIVHISIGWTNVTYLLDSRETASLRQGNSLVTKVSQSK